MRFSCDTNDLNTSLSIVSRALAVRSPKPILEGILLESCEQGLRLICTDLALGIQTTIPATFTEEGRAAVRDRAQAARRRLRVFHFRPHAGDHPLREHPHDDHRL